MFNFSKKSFLSLAVTSFLFVSSIAFSFSDLISIKPIQKAEAAVGTYYNNVSASKSADLLTSIRSTISSGYSSQGYSGLWTLYLTTDKRSDGKLYDWYSDKTNFTLGNGQCGTYSGIGDCYNREHSIPQSWWGGGTNNQGCDGFIVVPTDGKINGVRSNFPFGETTTGKEYKMSGDPSGNRLGSSTSTQYVSGTVFEPFDSRKGDFARIYFYAVARWNTSTWTSEEGSNVFSSTGNNGFVPKYAQMLIKWHHDDPVSDFEINRNDLVQSKQKNRNPFIDHSSWVDLIWGGTYGSNQKNGETTYTNWKVTNGVISDAGGGGGSTVSVTGVSLNKSSATLTVGDSLTLNATVSPSNATNKNVTWSTSNSSIATVSYGEVRAVNKGTATITATTVDGGYTATCLVTVNEGEDPEEPLTLLSISVTDRSKKTFYVNDRFAYPRVLANYSDGTSVDVSNYAECSGYDMSKEGTQTVLVVYYDEILDAVETTTYEIRVIKKNNGCGGEIASTSVIVSLLAVASAITLIISKRRKKESNSNI